MARAARKTSQAITIQTVAERAGVSAMTVSNVLNNRSTVREVTREAVLKAVRELDYRPNLAARSLATANSTRIGLLCRNIENAFLSSMLIGALDAASSLGAQLILRRLATAEPDEILKEALALVRSGANAIVAPPPYCETISACHLLQRIGVPVIGMSPGDELPDLSSVRIDDFGAAREMTAYLIGLGHRRIGFIRSGAKHLIDRTRCEGYLAALKDAGIEHDPALIATGNLPFDSGLRAADQLLHLENRPTAIFASNDDMAAAAASCAHRMGIDIPTDLSIAGFDDTPVAVMLWPSLTTVHQPASAISALATRRAIEIARHPQQPPEVNTTYLEHRLVIRESTAPPRTA